MTTLKSHLGGVANGQNLDPMANPDFAKLVNQTGTDAQNRINAQFAGAGRDLSGINQQSVARGVTQAELPILTDQYNRERAAQADAAKTIAGAGQSTATTQGQLDANRQGLQTQGVNLAGQALGAQNYGANQTLNLDQQQKQLPLQDLGLLAQLLYPAAGFGSSTQGQAQGSSTSAGFGLSLSDERAKEDIAEVGEMADGTTIYKWRYKGDPTFHTGPMAQEVEKKTPGAVVDDPDTGLKHVNLDAATRKAAEIVRKRKEKR